TIPTRYPVCRTAHAGWEVGRPHPAALRHRPVRSRDVRQRAVVRTNRPGSTGELPLRLRGQSVTVAVHMPGDVLAVVGVSGVEPLPLRCRVAESDRTQPAE